MQIRCPENTKSTMTSQEALQFIKTTLESKIGKQLTLPEKEILKAAWDNETYSNVAESLYLSLGYIKDLASLLWQRLSDTFGKKITKHNLRWVIETLCTTSTPPEEEIAENNTDENSETKGNILIVDDQIENLHFLTDILTQRGHKVRRVTNGKMALRSIRNNPPDIILLDIKTHIPQISDSASAHAGLRSNKFSGFQTTIFKIVENNVNNRLKIRSDV